MPTSQHNRRGHSDMIISRCRPSVMLATAITVILLIEWIALVKRNVYPTFTLERHCRHSLQSDGMLYLRMRVLWMGGFSRVCGWLACVSVCACMYVYRNHFTNLFPFIALLHDRQETRVTRSGKRVACSISSQPGLKHQNLYCWTISVRRDALI